MRQPLNFGRTHTVALVLFCVPAGAMSACVESTAVPVAGAVPAGLTLAVGARVANDVIGDVKRAAAQLMAEGRETGNAFLVTGANELNVAADNISRVLGDRVNQALDRLDASERQALNALQDLSTRAAQISRGAYDIKDSLVLDVRSILAGLPLLNADTFYIQRISGLAHIQKKSAYRITVTGLGLGPDSENSRSTIAVLLGGAPAPAILQQRTAANTVELEVPAGVLDPYFSIDRPTTLALELIVTREVKRGMVAPSWERKTYKVPFVISLLPRRAGTLHIEAIYPTYGWVSGAPETRAISTLNHGCNSTVFHKCGNTTTGYSVELKVTSSCKDPPLVGDRKLSEPSLWCASGPCGYSTNAGATLAECNSRATGRFTVHSTPTVWKLSAKVSEYKVTGEERFTRDVSFEWDSALSIEIPNDTTTGHISGELINKERIDFVLGATDPKLLLKFVQDTHGQPGSRRVVYQVGLPPGLE